MPFKLEAVFAKEGDSLLLHYGSDDDPSILLIDGGSHGVYADWLRPRLQQLRDELGERVPLQMIMISHVDSDHLTGILDLFEELQESDDPVCDVGSLWHNSFDDLVGNEASELTTAILQSLADGNQPESADPDSSAVAASVAQGRRLRQDAEALGISTNDRFTGLVIASPETVGPIDLGDGMTFRVLGPSLARVEALQGVWNRYLEEKELAEAVAAGLEDNSIPNLSSLVVLAEQDGKTMLLTGDARGDYIVEGLILAGLLPPEAELPILYTGMPRAERATKKMELAAAEAMENPPSVHLDLLKLPHHGSDRNVSTGFFRRVTADRYLCSADGNHHNPDVPTLRMIADARGSDPYTLYFTFTADQHLDASTNAEFRRALAEVDQWIRLEKPVTCTVVHRAPREALSVEVDLNAPAA